MEKPPIVAVVGPTAVGKTTLSLDLAERLGGEIVSADSRQVYRGLDLGSGKIRPDEMRGIPHHLLDIADPSTVFTAKEFVEAGREALQNIHARGVLPVVVGGTGFYVDALLGRVILPNVPPNEALRAELSTLPVETLAERLKERDPSAYERMDTKNPHRLMRALEIVAALGSVPPLIANETPYRVLWVGVTLPLEELKSRIHSRLGERLEHGMLDEARALYTQGLSYERMEELGLEYRAMARYLQGVLPYDDMVVELEKEIVSYAKRQMTWFKKNTGIQWFHPEEREKIFSVVHSFTEGSIV